MNKIGHFKINMGRLQELSAILISIAMILVCVAGEYAAPSYADSGSKTAELVKVGLRYGTSDATAAFSTSDGFVLVRVSEDTISKDNSVDLSKYDTLKFSLSGTNVVICDNSGQPVTSIDTDGTQAIAAADIFSDNAAFTFNGTAYRGAVLPYVNTSGKMNIINVTDVEDYVKGVVAKEIGSSAGAEAKKAQAVTARSYALANGGRHSSEGFDVCCTSHCQTFGGVAAETSSSDEAVDATAGKEMYYNGSPVCGYFFTNSGGFTADSEDVWSAALGYCRGRADEYSPEMTWEAEYTRAEITKALSSKGVGTVKSITIDGFDNGSYVSSVTVNGTSGSCTFTKDGVRSMFSSLGTLKSRMFTIGTAGGVLEDDRTGVAAGVTSSSENNFFVRSSGGINRLGDTLTVKGIEVSAVSSLEGLSIMGASGITSQGHITASAGSVTSIGGTMTVTFTEDTDTLKISGRGSGHGVGMSQEGAIEMAKQGFTYDQILSYYYANIEIR